MNHAVHLSVIEQGLLAQLLEQRFGDGSIYLRSGEDRRLLKRARSLGLVSAAGYLTHTGQCFLDTRTWPPEDQRPTDGNPNPTQEWLGEI